MKKIINSKKLVDKGGLFDNLKLRESRCAKHGCRFMPLSLSTEALQPTLDGWKEAEFKQCYRCGRTMSHPENERIFTSWTEIMETLDDE